MTMIEQQYLAPSLHSEGLSGPPSLPDGAQSSSTATSVSAYPDLTPYASVSSSFNLSTQCDSSALLTPISVSGSPPLHQIQKLVPQYPPPPSTPGTQQQPTPPGSSKMYHQQWNFDMNSQSSQTSSPMTQPPVQSEFMENGTYIHDGRRTPGPPTEQYMGNFAVSDGSEPQTMNHPYYVQPMHPIDHSNPMMIRSNHPMSMGMHHREISNQPLMSDPHAPHLRQQRRSSAEDHGIHGLPAESGRSVNTSPRRRAIQATTSRVKKRTQKSRGPQSRTAPVENPHDEHRNCFGQEVAPTLKSSCPEEERCIFESRWNHRHQKGQDMWESIQSDFKARFNKSPGKEMLQMKFKRGRSKYIQWLPRDEQILREAFYEHEKQRYQNIFEIFLERGGSRNMRLSASDIEVKLVNDMKLEEGFYMDPQANIRRRVKAVVPKKRSKGGAEEPEVPVSDEIMSVSSHNTHEDEVINQVYNRSDAKWEDDSSQGNEVMDAQMWDQSIKIERDVVPHGNERVSRQSYDQVPRASPGTQPTYGRRRAS